MKKVIIPLVIFFLLAVPNTVKASEEVAVATESAIASESAVLSSTVGDTAQVDLTVPKEEGDRLVRVLNTQEVSGWWFANSFKLAIRKAVAEGVSPNTLVLLFLFPIVAALAAFSRQVVGLSGFGIIVPALLSVAFVSTGGVVGLVLLSFILLSAIFGRVFIRRIKVPYLPKLAILIWLISLSVLCLLIMSPLIGLDRLMNVGIFPIMIFVLLAETFVEAQITRSMSTSIAMTLETVILAFIAYKVMSSPFVQSTVLLNPEISVISILVIDILIGKYKGLRLLEIWRFRKMISK